MAKIDIIDIGSVSDPKEFQRYCSKFASNVFNVLNGKLEFDVNMLTQTVEVTFSAINTDTKIPHNLNKTGLRYFVIKKSAACDVYDGATAATNQAIYLKATVATTVTIVLC